MIRESSAFMITLITYTISVLAYFIFFISRKETFYVYGKWLIRTGLIFHTIALASRTVEASYLPITNQYEFAASFGWGIVLCFIGFEWKYKFKALGAFAGPLILLVTYYAALQSKEIRPLMPALQSNWMIIHVGTAIFSYGAFAVACAVSVMYIIRDRFEQDDFIIRYLPELQTLDTISYRAISIGVILLTLVIITGAIWADNAWGRYWQWDPKETWSLITWIIYTIYLHIRLSKGWQGKRAAWYAILGFISILFTYIGVNTILTGYHSYAMMGSMVSGQ